MSLFRRESQSEERAVTSLPWTWEGRSTSSGESVTSKTAMQHDAVWACVNIIADTIASLPVDVFRGSGATRVPVQTPSQILHPSSRLDLRDWVAQGVTSLALRGEAMGFVTAFDQAMRPAAVEWLDPLCFSVEDTNPLVPAVYRLDGQVVPRERVVHLRDRTMPGCVRGLSPIEYHAETIGLGIAAQKFGAQWFGDGAHPSAVLSTDQRIDEKQAEDMKKRFVASLRKRREPAVLGSGIQYTPVQVTANESQFLETIGANAAQIARIFRVPPEMIGAAVSGSNLTYANREQRWQDFVSMAIMPRLVRIEDVLTSMTPRPQRVKFNLDAVLRADLKTRYEAHQIGIDAKFLLPNEARAIEDLPPIDGGDEFPAAPAAPAPAMPADGGAK